jgi:PAS domain S-box-containing protein
VHCTPLVGKAGQRLGVLTLLFQSPQRLSDADLRRLDLYSRQAVDFLERCTFEERLRASDRRFRNLADTAPAMLWVTDGNGACTFLSRGWHEYTGQSPEAALGWGWLDAVHPDDRDQCEQALQDADSRHVAFTLDYRLRRFDGAYRWAFDAGRPRFDDKGGFLGFIGSVIDIHERRQAEDTRRDVEQRFQLLADNMSELAWIAEADGRINWCNRRWFEYTGMNARESNGWGWTLALHPEEISRIVERVRHTIDAGATWEDTILLRGRDNRYRWFLSRATPVCDDKGRATRWLGTHTDVTEQRAAQDLLREADSRKDRVLATLAHELRNPLAPLRNGLQLLKLAVDNPETVGRTQSMMERQLEQMVRLVDDLQDLSRVSQGKVRLQFETIDLAAAVRQAIETNGPACSQAKHRLFTSFPAETVYVTGDFTRLAVALRKNARYVCAVRTFPCRRRNRRPAKS